MASDAHSRFVEFPTLGHAWTARIRRLDPMGPIVTLHAVTLTVFSVTEHAAGVLVLSVVFFGWRVWLGRVAARADRMRRGGVYLLRAVVSLVLAGGIVAFDRGTESPLFFSMVILVVWEAVVTPLRRFVIVAGAAVATLLGVMAAVPDVTAASIIRLGVFAVFVLLLMWARAMSEAWQRESTEAQDLAASIAENAPVGFALYDRQSLRCLYANEVAVHHGLDHPEETTLTPFGERSVPTLAADVLAEVAASGEPLAPTLYSVQAHRDDPRFLRLGVTIHSTPDWMMLYAEDVTAQVTVGEQHRRFLESANHHFRTPLSPIKVYGELIAQAALEGDELREAGVAIRDAGQRIERLLDRISSLLRLQRDPARHGSTVTFGELIEEHLLGSDPDLGPCLDIQGRPDLLVRCDPRPLSAALRELIENGRRHGTPPVSLSAQVDNGHVVLRVSDHGPGPVLDPGASLDQMWTQMARAEVMPPQMGERLGLAFASTLSRAAGASLIFERDQTGWAFTFRLPSGESHPAIHPRHRHRSGQAETRGAG